MKVSDNFYSYRSDFLEHPDVTGYFNWKDGLPYLRLDNELWEYNPLNRQLVKNTSADPTDGIEMPKQLYVAWESASPGARQGFALIRFRGTWYIAIRIEMGYLIIERAGYCIGASLCKEKAFFEKSCCPENSKYIFLFSDADRSVKWPPQKSRTWILLPHDMTSNPDWFLNVEHLRHELYPSYKCENARVYNECTKSREHTEERDRLIDELFRDFELVDGKAPEDKKKLISALATKELKSVGAFDKKEFQKNLFENGKTAEEVLCLLAKMYTMFGPDSTEHDDFMTYAAMVSPMIERCLIDQRYKFFIFENDCTIARTVEFPFPGDQLTVGDKETRVFAETKSEARELYRHYKTEAFSTYLRLGHELPDGRVIRDVVVGDWEKYDRCD